MNQNKLTYLALGMLLLPLIGVAFVVALAKSAQVYARETTRNAPTTHLTQMADMMGTSGKNQMVDMMKTHHGDNWQEDCNKMMEELTKES